MRIFQFIALSGLMLTSHVALAAGLENDDVPSRCWDVCSPVIDITDRCEKMYRDDDEAEMKCICNWSRAPTSIPLCEACTAKYRNDRDDDDRDDIHDNDAYDILTSCSLSTTTYNSAAATSILSNATSPASTAATTSAGTTQGGSGSSAGSSAATGTTSNSQSSRTSTPSGTQPTGNAAPGSVVPQAASIAAIVGLFGLAWL